MGSISYLLDTCTLLWALRGEHNLSAKAREAIADSDTIKLVSAVSAYEIMFKYRIGKLTEYEYVAENYFDVLEKFCVGRLPLYERHTYLAGKLNWENRDPFDRLLAA